MKTTDFMVGDWVFVNDTPRKIQAIDGVDDEIMADDELYTFCQDRVHSEDDIQPVPLTPKILEKNGFKSYGESWYLPDDIKVMVGFYMYKTTVSVKKGDDIFQKEIRCSYRACAEERGMHVHTLQHALRLCGIKHDIIL